MVVEDGEGVYSNARGTNIRFSAASYEETKKVKGLGDWSSCREDVGRRTRIHRLKMIHWRINGPYLPEL